MSVVGALIGGAASGLFGKLAGAVDKRITTKAEREQLKRDLQAALDRHVEELTKIATDQERQHAEELANARAMNVSIQQSTTASWLARNVGYVLDLLVATVWGSCTVYLLLRALKLVGDGADLTAVLAIYSTVTATFMTSLTFHRGSSRGSEIKDQAIRARLDRDGIRPT